MTASTPTPLRIAIVRSRYTPFGGAERFVERALAALVAEGAEVSLIARDWAGAPPSGARQIICNPPYSRLGGRTARDRTFAAAVQAEIAHGGYDIVQSHERIPGAMLFRAGDGVHAAWLDRRAQALGWSARLSALAPYHRYICRAEADMFAHPVLQAVICNSQMVKDEILRYYGPSTGIDAARLHVIHNGVDLERFSPALVSERAALRQQYGIPADAPLLLYVGSGFARKGIPPLLEALAALPRQDVYLLAVGADRKLKQAKQQAAALGLGDRAIFTGPLPDVRACYGAADAFVLPTLYDPFPNAALEALACGLPTLTTDGCGVAEILTPGVNGCIVPAGQVPPLTAALGDLLALLERDPQAARAAARAAAEPLSLTAMTGRLLDLYRSLAAGR